MSEARPVGSARTELSAAEPLFRVRGLSKTYASGRGRIEVLQALDLDVAVGEMVAIVGASGVGKSTLLHILGGVDRADAGEIRYCGQALPSDEKGLARFRNHHVGFVFQFHHLLPEFTAEENVLMPLLVRGETRLGSRGRDLLASLGLAARTHHRPAQLSGGEQQRVAIARALVTNPSVILADEPTGNLDTATGREVFSALAEAARERGLATVMATHNGDLAAQCNRVLRLVDGRLQPAASSELHKSRPEVADE